MIKLSTSPGNIETCRDQDLEYVFFFVYSYTFLSGRRTFSVKVACLEDFDRVMVGPTSSQTSFCHVDHQRNRDVHPSL